MIPLTGSISSGRYARLVARNMETPFERVSKDLKGRLRCLLVERGDGSHGRSLELTANGARARTNTPTYLSAPIPCYRVLLGNTSHGSVRLMVSSREVTEWWVVAYIRPHRTSPAVNRLLRKVH